MKEVRIALTRIEDSAKEFLPLIEKAPNAFYLDFFKKVVYSMIPLAFYIHSARDHKNHSCTK